MRMNDKYLKRLFDYFMWLPFAGFVLLPIMSIWFFFVEGEAVTWWRILWNSGGIIFYGLMGLPFYLILSKKPPFLVGFWKWITIGLVLLSIGIMIFRGI